VCFFDVLNSGSLLLLIFLKFMLDVLYIIFIFVLLSHILYNCDTFIVKQVINFVHSLLHLLLVSLHLQILLILLQMQLLHISLKIV